MSQQPKSPSSPPALPAAPQEPQEGNPFRDVLPLRLCGYANEVGESFRLITPPWFVRATYGVAFAYVLGDTTFSFWSAGQQQRQQQQQEGPSLFKKQSRAAAETFLWQMLASVTIPGATINLTVKAASFLVGKAKNVSPAVVRWGPVGVGLAAIPLIIHPIDHLVDSFMASKPVKSALDATFAGGGDAPRSLEKSAREEQSK